MSELPPHSLFEEIYRHHGHRCPMSTLGGRLGYAARSFLGAVPDDRLSAVYHARTCALDGIGAATGCDESDGRLGVREEGRHLLHLFDHKSGDGVAVSLQKSALEIAWEYRCASQKLDVERPGLGAEELNCREHELKGLLDSVLDRLRNLPDDNLLVVQPIKKCREDGMTLYA